ncbi:MAG: hypothetical protein OXC83_11925 [Chloroflexi bacterium]|nr:hypothetical protein [Chloroflexota bacterium]
MTTKATVEFDKDVADFLDEECRRQNKPIGQVVNEVVRQQIPPVDASANDRKPYRVEPFEGGFKPEFEGMTPKEILNKLDDEYYAKKLAGGTDAYNEQKKPQ